MTKNKETSRLEAPMINILPLIPLKELVILPTEIIPLIVGYASSIQAIEYALKKDKSIFIATQKNSSVASPTISDLFTHGLRATIKQASRRADGSFMILIEGIMRARMIKVVEQPEGFLSVECEDLPTTGLEQTAEFEALWGYFKNVYTAYSKLNCKAPADLMATATTEDMDTITDTLPAHINLTFNDSQLILEAVNLQDRILNLCYFLQKEIDTARAEQPINAFLGKIKAHSLSLDKLERELYIHEQIKAIQKKLDNDQE